MGFDNSSHGGGGNNSLIGSGGLISDINVTPFVDVLLVLLIVFMVGAPLAISGIDIDLPKGNNKLLSMSQDPIVISIDNNGEIFLKESKVALKNLSTKLRSYGSKKEKPMIYIRADRGVSYGRVMEIMSICQNEGFRKLGMMNAASFKR